MTKITIDAEKCIAEMEDSKYKVNDSSYTKGCNDVIDFYIKQLKRMIEENEKHKE